EPTMNPEHLHQDDTATLVATVLRGDMSSLPRVKDDAGASAFLEAAAHHDVEPLLRRVLQANDGWSMMPSLIQTALDARARREAAVEGLRYREVTRVLGSLRKAGVTALVLKGGALAYTHYPAPYLRPRGDTDLLVKPEDRAKAREALGDLG